MKRIIFPFLLITGSLCFGQVDLNLGLRAYYPFSGNANDVSGNNNNPVFNNATLTADRFGNANSSYHFNGTSNYMRILNNAALNTTNKISLCAWVRPMGFYAGTCHANAMIMKGDADYLTGNYLVRFDDATYLNYTNCSVPMDPLHQNFYGYDIRSAPPGYSPYIQPNQWYSVIVTYDGTTAKLYVNCELKMSGPQGSLTFTNLYDLYLGKLNSAAFPYWLNGDLDEVRIYDRALTADEVNVLGGCPISATSVSGIINSYTPVLALDACNNKLTVEDASTFNIGDTVLMIQMKGAVIDSTNTASFGTITDYKNAGNYEFNYVKSKAGNLIELKNILTRQYDIPTGKVQLIRVPYYTSANVSATLTCLPWDGSKGGVLAVNVSDTLNLSADIDLNGKGFRGGQSINTPTIIGIYHQTDYAYPANPNIGARKGEGIAEVSENLIFCRGPLSSGGGGGNSHNSGGGGGGNGGIGGKGGDEWAGAIPVLPVGGIGGKNLINATVSNKIFMGAGGGAGQNDNGSATSGGKGGGIAIINSRVINPNSNKIISNGLQGVDCINIGTCSDGVGGGGAGGTILINSQMIISNIPVQANGGKGADNNIPGVNAHGTGGGGAGGNLFVNSAALLSNITYSSIGGIAGKAFNQGSTNWGATGGGNGISASGVTIPYSTTPFLKNIDSVRIHDSTTSCLNIDFKGLAYINITPINTWQWYFGDGGTANTQNTFYTYTNPGTYTVKLVVTDLNGCRDSVSKPVTVSNCSGISSIINTYTPALALNLCNNQLTVEDASTFNVGDTVLLIQMKGAVIDSTNTSAFGTITDYKNAGNYEFNYVKSKTGNIIELKNILTRQYDIPVGKVQLIRVPYYDNINISDTLTCLPWDGSKGGVLVLNAQNTVNLQADINVTGKGFIGSLPITNIPPATLYNQPDYAYPANVVDGSRKGEGIAVVSENLIFCRGPLASGGGGANSHNAGGGGGGNGGAGGKGGNEWGGSAIILANGGMGGKNYAYSAAANKIFIGGAGGAGHANDGTGTAGGNGGGLVIIFANTITPNSHKIISNGLQGIDCVNLAVCADGVGGGGSGGTIIINAQTITSNFQVQTNGGKGADNNINGPNATGPGGGGGGGTLLVNSGTILGNITYSAVGGIAGKAFHQANTNWGALNGSNGISLSNFITPNITIPFKINIDSVRIKDSLLSCNGFDFKGLAYVNANPINSWQWYFGDGNLANTQNTSHAYISAGTYTVKLVVTDINGCKDSTTKDVTALPGIVADAGIDTSFCSNTPVSKILHGSGTGTYSWTPAIYLDDPTLQNPTATISSTTRFYLTVTSASACTALDSVTLTVNPVPLVQTLIDTAICKNSVLVLTTTPGAGTYSWSPPIYVSDPTIASPMFIDTLPRTLFVTGTNSFGCFAKDTINISIKTLPIVRTIKDTIICSTQTVTLVTSGAQSYSWTPAIFLSDPTIANPVYSGNLSQTYYVTGTAANGCKAKDTVSVTVNFPMVFQAPPDKSMCDKSSVVLDGYNGTSVDYLWSPGTYLSNTTIINPVASPPSTTSYSVLITDRACNTDSSFTVQVMVGVKPVINAGKSNDIDCANHTATLRASGGNTYLWTPSTGLSSTVIPNPVATPASTQTYVVLVTDAGGCSNKDSVTVFSNLSASLARYMPNAFTPNGDGKNDCYGLKNWVYIKKLQFYIYNRYGEIVFATANPANCWDGNYRGKKALAGTYVFYIKAETACGTEEQKGNFLLLR